MACKMSLQATSCHIQGIIEKETLFRPLYVLLLVFCPFASAFVNGFWVVDGKAIKNEDHESGQLLTALCGSLWGDLPKDVDV